MTAPAAVGLGADDGDAGAGALDAGAVDAVSGPGPPLDEQAASMRLPARIAAAVVVEDLLRMSEVPPYLSRPPRTPLLRPWTAHRRASIDRRSKVGSGRSARAFGAMIRATLWRSLNDASRSDACRP
jgi:hypothetical protein